MPDIDPILELISKKYYFVIMLVSVFSVSMLVLILPCCFTWWKKVAKKHADASQNCDRKRDLQL